MCVWRELLSRISDPRLLHCHQWDSCRKGVHPSPSSFCQRYRFPVSHRRRRPAATPLDVRSQRLRSTVGRILRCWYSSNASAAVRMITPPSVGIWCSHQEFTIVDSTAVVPESTLASYFELCHILVLSIGGQVTTGWSNWNPLRTSATAGLTFCKVPLLCNSNMYRVR
jgi:hypothetical protein